MNPTTIVRIYQASESTGRHRFGGKKPISGDKRRRTEEYGLKRSNHQRRKQTKVSYDTWRREEMNNEEDDKLSNIHYANFLGDKCGDSLESYDATISNVSDCDCMRDDYFVEMEKADREFQEFLDEHEWTKEQACAFMDNYAATHTRSYQEPQNCDRNEYFDGEWDNERAQHYMDTHQELFQEEEERDIIEFSFDVHEDEEDELYQGLDWVDKLTDRLIAEYKAKLKAQKEAEEMEADIDWTFPLEDMQEINPQEEEPHQSEDYDDEFCAAYWNTEEVNEYLDNYNRMFKSV